VTAPSHDEQEDDRRRRPVLLWLGAVAAALLVLGAGGLLLDGDAAPEAGRTVRPPDTLPPVIVDEPAAVADGSVSDAVSGAGAGRGLAASALGLQVEGAVRGHVGPGTPAVLVLTVANPLTADVVLTSATGRVVATDRTGCRVEWYRVGGFTGGREVPAGDRISIELPVTFVSDPGVNQDACKGAAYRFTVDVRGRQA